MWQTGLGHHDLKHYRDAARAAANRGRLVFVVGAGINTSRGGPTWSELLGELAKSAPGLARNLAKTRAIEAGKLVEAQIANVLLQARVLRRALPGSSWERAMIRAVSPGGKESAADPLRAVARVICAQALMNPHRSIEAATFNYDSLLEESIRRELESTSAEIRIRKVYSAQQYRDARLRPKPGVYIYHLHGSVDAPNEVILDDSSYLKILEAPGRHWSWRCLDALLDRREECDTAIYVGLSLADPSLSLWLGRQSARFEYTASPPSSALFVTGPPMWSHRRHEVKAARSLERFADEALLDLGLVAVRLHSWNDLAEMLDDLYA